MNKGVEILLARMDSHPEEFSTSDRIPYSRYGQWDSCIEAVLNTQNPFTDEEREAVQTKLNELTLEQFTQRVMKKLLDGPEPAERSSGQLIAGRQIRETAYDEAIAARERMKCELIKMRSQRGIK